MNKKFFRNSVNTLTPYKITATDVYNNNNDFLKLDWNESTIPPSNKVLDAISNIIKKNRLHWYPPNLNIPLLESLANYCKVETDNIQYFAGSDSLHEYIIQACIDPNDSVVVVTPTYDNFRAVVSSYGGKIYKYKLEEPFDYNIKDLISYIKKINPKLVYICSPNNPTGTIYTYNDLEYLIKKISNSLIIIDEAYYEFSGITLANLVGSCDNFIISRTFSKAFGLASFRIGYCIAHHSIINTLNKVRNPKSVSLFAQFAAQKALEDIKYLNNFVKNVDKSKIMITSFFDNYKIKYFVGGGNYILVNSSGFGHEKILLFLKKNNILVRDLGHIQSLQNYIRITLGLEENTSKVVSVFEKFINNK
tara:strand:+ start:541 stop:1629 length:1089 start_codon:yes stop_codon:yes gene_type:complete